MNGAAFIDYPIGTRGNSLMVNVDYPSGSRPNSSMVRSGARKHPYSLGNALEGIPPKRRKREEEREVTGGVPNLTPQTGLHASVVPRVRGQVSIVLGVNARNLTGFHHASKGIDHPSRSARRPAPRSSPFTRSH